MFVRSRPYDTATCTLGNQDNCHICPLITDGNTCAVKNIVYHVTCNYCNEGYGGETGRPAHARFLTTLGRQTIRHPTLKMLDNTTTIITMAKILIYHSKLLNDLGLQQDARYQKLCILSDRVHE